MIIIFDKSQVIGNWAPVAHQAPLKDLDVTDVLNRFQVTTELFKHSTLFIVTDAENSEFKVFKDDQGVFEEGKVYSNGEIGGLTWLYISRWLASLKIDWEDE